MKYKRRTKGIVLIAETPYDGYVCSEIRNNVEGILNDYNYYGDGGVVEEINNGNLEMDDVIHTRGGGDSMELYIPEQILFLILMNEDDILSKKKSFILNFNNN